MNRERELVRGVSLVWYAWALLLILILVGGSFAGYLPAIFTPVALFALLFWFFSLLFVLYGKWKHRQRGAE